ncbi:putative anti-anti-sigma regulatory factor (fragment) [Magnetospirillum sp. XM-1]|uniref:STAS domain-containing protein n=1 Tax=Magnetospirillum sp. XM-1 TaxID=1663591 RepID=UPI00073DFD76
MRHADCSLIVALDGRLDYTAWNLMSGLIDDLRQIASDRVVFDVSKVSTVDCVGLGMLCLARDALGTTLALRGASGPFLLAA